MALSLLEQLSACFSAAVPAMAAKAEMVARILVDDLQMTSMDQLALLRDTDLVPPLSVFEARALVAALQVNDQQHLSRNENHRPRPQGSSDEDGNQRNNRENHQPLGENQSDPDRKWDFNINWTDIYNIDSDLRGRMSKGKKLRKKQKKAIITRLINQVRNKVPHAKRDIFVQIMKDMKKKYPVTFSGELAKGKIAKKSLCKRMQNKYDNDRRPVRRTTIEKEAPAIKAAYGCKKWRLASLPDNETQETLQEHQLSLKRYFEETRPSAWDWETIEDGMKKTYGSQRADINKQALEIEKNKKRKDANQQIQEFTLTESLREKWPFLTVPRIMLLHFQMLTEVDITSKLTSFLENDIKDIVTFLLATNKGNTRKIKKKMRRSDLEGQNPRLGALLLLLLQRFKEEFAGLFIIVDETASEDDIPTQCDIPKTPHLIIAGDSLFKYRSLYFCLDGSVLGFAKTLIEGFGLLFASYYVFNLVYEATAQITLEFFQRCVADINPARGNKRPPKTAGGRYSAYSIHPALPILDTKYDEYFAEVDSEEGSENADNPGDE